MRKQGDSLIDEKLYESIEDAIENMTSKRDLHKEFVANYVGNHYSNDQSLGSIKIYENNIELYVATYKASMAPVEIITHVTFDIMSLSGMAKTISIGANKDIKEANLADCVNRVFVDSLFTLGIVKVGLSKIGTYGGHDISAPFADYVPFDNYFIDMSAESGDAIQFEGNDYWLEEDLIEQIFDKKVDGNRYDATIDESQGGKTKTLSGENESVSNYKERVHLRDVWLPSQNKMLTYVVETKELLGEVEYDGDEDGPYEKLFYWEVPGNILPLSPIAAVFGLSTLFNDVYRKNGMQAMSQKNMSVVMSGDEDDAMRANSTPDGYMVAMRKGSRPEKINVGGLQTNTMVFADSLRNNFSRQAGNLDSLGGLRPQADTAKQEGIVNENASGGVAYMSGRLDKFVNNIVRRFMYYRWTDPVSKMDLEKPIGKTGLVLPVQWNSETQEGDFLDFNFDVEIISAIDKSPEARYQKIVATLNEVVLPLGPDIQRANGYIDAQAIIKRAAELRNLPEMEDIVKFDLPVQTQEESADRQVTKPPSEPKVYQHIGGGGQPDGLANMLQTQGGEGGGEQ
jgi:hypothetical protein